MVESTALRRGWHFASRSIRTDDVPAESETILHPQRRRATLEAAPCSSQPTSMRKALEPRKYEKGGTSSGSTRPWGTVDQAGRARDKGRGYACT